MDRIAQLLGKLDREQDLQHEDIVELRQRVQRLEAKVWLGNLVDRDEMRKDAQSQRN